MKSLSILSLLFLQAFNSFCQEDSTTAIEAPKTTFTIGAQYANNSNYYGQRPVDPTPYTAIVGSVHFPSGLYFNAMAYRLMKDSNALISAGSITAGIDFKIAGKWTGDLSFSHALYRNNSPFLQASLSNTASASLSHQWWMNTSLTTDYCFGETNDVFVTLATSKFIPFGSLFSSKDGIAITPELSATAGTQHFYKSYVSNKIIHDSIAGLPIPIFGSETSSDTTTTHSTSFSLLTYNLKIPLSYYRAHYVVEAAAQFSMLSEQVNLSPESINSFFTVSFYYQF
jgi:hypothetical protein